MLKKRALSADRLTFVRKWYQPELDPKVVGVDDFVSRAILTKLRLNILSVENLTTITPYYCSEHNSYIQANYSLIFTMRDSTSFRIGYFTTVDKIREAVNSLSPRKSTYKLYISHASGTIMFAVTHLESLNVPYTFGYSHRLFFPFKMKERPTDETESVYHISFLMQPNKLYSDEELRTFVFPTPNKSAEQQPPDLWLI